MQRPAAPRLTVDSLLQAADSALRTLFAPAHGAGMPPNLPGEVPLAELDRRRVAGMMRVNHAGEVAAQALYQAQALLARSVETRAFMLRAAAEEGGHLAWCEQRLKELGDRPSLLNPFWYAGSFAIGAAAAVLSDRLSMGFVTETERQVEGHLAAHLKQLPAADQRSRRILETMQSDEIGHADAARAAGASELPKPVRQAMRLTSRLMTRTAYWI